MVSLDIGAASGYLDFSQLCLRPGSPTDRVYAPYNTYGIVEVTVEGIEARIVKV